MPSTRRGLPPSETALFAIFLFWLVIIPLPFGGVTDRAQPLLIVPPLLFGAAAALLRATRRRQTVATPAYRIACGAAIVFLAIVLVQLLPLPPSLLATISPESYAIWSRAATVAGLTRQPVAAAWPISIDPPSTWLHLFRISAYLGTFVTAAMTARRHLPRLALALALSGGALFQALYGIREAALQRYAIWGWKNTKIFNRVTGTFVNPNHFADYAAILLPLALMLAATAWHEASSPTMPLRTRVARLVERRFILFGFGACAAFGCVVAILVAQSRGALLALAVGALVVGGMIATATYARHHAAIGTAAAAVALVLLVFGLTRLLGLEAAMERMASRPDEETSIAGRRSTIEAGLAIWSRFPIAGSGLGTFDRVSPMVQHRHLDYTYNHAHDDYVEIAATTGAAGFTVAMVGLIALYALLFRMTFGRDAATVSWHRRAFQAAALASFTIAAVHALIDFSFFIPAIPVTLAAVLGAAVAPRASS